MARSKSSQNWLKEHHQDPFVLQARREGYRSRAVYKLDEIQKKDRIFGPGQRVLDLGAAPGGWCEYASRYSGSGGCIIAVDLLPIDPIAGVEIVQGDFSEQETLQRIMAIIDARPLDLVLSDMAPNISGMESVDQPRAMYLAELALQLATECLQESGILVVKLFQGAGFDAITKDMRASFKRVKLRKPEASRARSREIYAVCSQLK